MIKRSAYGLVLLNLETGSGMPSQWPLLEQCMDTEGSVCFALLFFRKTTQGAEFLQLTGNFVLPIRCTTKAISYKYIVCAKKRKKKGKVDYEQEYEFLKKGRDGETVNRILLLPKQHHGSDKGRK